jgi:hypothetical protein
LSWKEKEFLRMEEDDGLAERENWATTFFRERE